MASANFTGSLGGVRRSPITQQPSLGFYLFRGGIKPLGLARKRDEQLNAGLAVALQPIVVRPQLKQILL